MKKSKVVIPAMALILFSTAASISGTVAWFTANRAVTFTTSNFALVTVDGNLDITLSPGVGTKITDKQVNPYDTNHELSDASFNPLTKQLWNDDGTGSSFVNVGNTSTYQSAASHSGAANDWFNKSYKVTTTDHYVYHAFTWTARVIYTWGADTTNLNVFFDYADSEMTGAEGTTATKTGSTTRAGFRIAFICGHTGRTVVWAGLQAAANLKAVTAANAETVYGKTGLTATTFSYFASDAFDLGNVAADGTPSDDGDYSKATDRAYDQTDRADFIGAIVNNSSTRALDDGTKNYIDIYCVAWYEGSDPSIVDTNRDDLEQVSSSIKFYSAIDGGATPAP